MTTQPPADDLPRDPRFDAAWRAASSETPPPALDAAIRAAARREVGAGPTRDAPRVAEATRPERWWWPLAAAATIGAIAIGVLQTAPQERDATKAVVSDVPADAGAAGRRAEDARKDAARATDAAPIMTPPAAEPRRAAPMATEPAARPEPRTGEQRAAPGSAGRDTAMPATTVQRADEALRAPAEPRAAAKPAAVEPAPPRAPQPFPAGTGAAESASVVEGKTDALAKRETRAYATGGAEPVPTPSAAAPPASAAADRVDRAESATTPQAAGTIAAPAGARVRSDAAAFAPSPPAEPQQTAEAAASARQLAAAKVSAEQRADPALDAKLKERARLPVADWIALIRKLRDEGRSDDAALELKAFRARYADADVRLPADLRDWPPGRR